MNNLIFSHEGEFWESSRDNSIFNFNCEFCQIFSLFNLSHLQKRDIVIDEFPFNETVLMPRIIQIQIYNQQVKLGTNSVKAMLKLLQNISLSELFAVISVLVLSFSLKILFGLLKPIFDFCYRTKNLIGLDQEIQPAIPIILVC